MDISYQEKLEKLQGNQEFLELLAKAETSEDIVNTFAKYGVVMSEEEALYIKDMIDTDKELDIEDLDNVAGGVPAAILIPIGCLIALCIIIGGVKKIIKQFK